MALPETDASAPPAPAGAVAPPPPMREGATRQLIDDFLSERRARVPFPDGLTDFDPRRVNKFIANPLPILLDCYERFGPIFSLRIFHVREVFMIGPEANHFVLVSGRENLHWREGNFRELLPLLGDGLLTIDGPYHDRARAIMMPAFHHDRINAMVGAMASEVEAALDAWRVGETIDVYEWTRKLAMRIAMRALLGLDPDDADSCAAAAHHFERALGIYSTGLPRRMLKGPGTAYNRMLSSRRELDRVVHAEIRHRRAHPDPERYDLMTLLLLSEDEHGAQLSDDEVRDQVMTLMFAGHDTTTSTISFMMYELSRNRPALERLLAEQDEVLGAEMPTAAHLARELPQLEMTFDETLRLYPPAWVGPRRAIRDFEFGGYQVPQDAFVNYCSWASHRLPEFFPDPEAFIPERFTRERKAALPRGAYVPFGGGPRICIGKRFGQTEVKLLATRILQRFRLELPPAHEMKIRQMPTLSPIGGLRMRIRERG
ncbi:cytochrome P450 [soil metagenome]